MLSAFNDGCWSETETLSTNRLKPRGLERRRCRWRLSRFAVYFTTTRQTVDSLTNASLPRRNQGSPNVITTPNFERTRPR